VLTSGLIIFTSPSHSLRKKKNKGGGREEAAQEGRAGDLRWQEDPAVPGAHPTRGSTHGWELEGKEPMRRGLQEASPEEV